MVSRKDVAIAAGVSQATVTNVYNRVKYVSPEIRAKVLQAALEVGYQDVSTMEFVLLVKDADNPYNGMILSGMKEAAMRYGAEASMVLVDNDADRIVDALIKRKVAGIFSAISEDAIDQKMRTSLENSGVGFSSSWEDFQIDFQEAIDQMVSYLFGMGHSRIAYLSGIPMQGSGNIRFAGFCSAIEKIGGTIHKELLIDGVFPYTTDVDSGYQAMKKLIDSGEKFTAVYAVNDLMALGAVRALREAGLNIPADVSVVGCDNIRLGEYANPPLTTLDVSAREMGRQIVYTLLQKSSGSDTQKIHIVPQLIVRKSTGQAKKID